MKKLIAILLSVMMIVGMMVLPTAAADEVTLVTTATPKAGDLNYNADDLDWWFDLSWYDENQDGKADADVFEISTAAQLYGLAYLTHIQTSLEAMEALTDGKTFKLTADINLNPDGIADTNANRIEFPGILRFCGTLDGQGHTISGLYMKTATTSVKIEGTAPTDTVSTNGLNTKTTTTEAAKTSTGDFGFICRVMDGTIRNLVMTNGLVKNGAPFIAAISGNTSPYAREKFGATIENVYVDVDADRSTQSGNYLGGIVNACYFNKGTASVTINNVVYAGNIDAQCTIKYGIGGIWGYAQFTSAYTLTMNNCVVLGEVSKLDTDTTSPLGRVIGKTSAAGITQTYCYESADALKTAMDADDTLANNWKTTDKGVVPATVAEMLNAQNVVIQRSAEVETTFSLRILQGISDLNWKSVGFRVELWDATNETWYNHVDSTVTKVYTSITAAGEDVEASEEPFESDYIYGVVINGVPASGTVKLRITPLKEMTDGTVVCYQAQAVECTIIGGEVQK